MVLVCRGANFSKYRGHFGVLGGLSPKICIASMGYLRIQGGLEPPGFEPPGFGAYVGMYGMLQILRHDDI